MAWKMWCGAGLSAALLLCAAPAALAQQAETPSGQAAPESGGQSERARDDGGGDRGRWRMHRHGEHGGMMMRRGFRGLCRPGGGRLVDIMLSRLERVADLRDAQRPALDKLKDAVARARDIALAGCPTERSITPTGRLAAAEKRLVALLDAIRVVRPPLEEFFAQLTDEQKARLYAFSARLPIGGYGGYVPPWLREHWREMRREMWRERMRDDGPRYGRRDRGGASRDDGDRPRTPMREPDDDDDDDDDDLL